MECDGEHMKKYRGKTATKIWIFILCMIFGSVTVVGGMMTVVCMYFGYFTGRNSQEIKAEFFDRAYNRNALYALEEGEKNNYGISDFTNYEFALLPGDDWSDEELKNSKNYLVSNFSNGFPEEYQVKSYEVGDKTTFHIQDEYLENSYVTTGELDKEVKIDALAMHNDAVYALIENEYYDITDLLETFWGDDGEADYYMIDGLKYAPNDFSQYDASKKIRDLKNLSNIRVSSDRTQMYATMTVEDPSLKTYTVVSATKKTIIDEGNDLIYEANEYYNYSKTASVLGWVLLIGGGIITLICFIWLLCLSGYHSKEKVSRYEIYQGTKIAENLYLQRRGLDCIPMDVALFLILCIEPSVIVAAVDLIQYSSRETFLLSAMGVLLLCVLGGGCGLLYCMTLASNFKNPTWWKNTLVYHICHLAAMFGREAKNSLRQSAKSVKMHTRIWVLYGILAFVELVVLSGVSSYMSSDGFGILISFWFIEKVLFAFLLIKLLRQFAEIKAATKEITEGNLSASVNTEKMFIDLQEEGEYINSIKNGLDVAIEERMKSERFQTELITNVSHDIKTPLTSIINYVDLLGKEDLKNDKAKEYLEVLQRQSQRLKKLLQDLLDASKASTGNVELHMEKVDAGVLLNQTLGEFEEKLQKSGVELKVKMPSSSPSITADSRYLWRVFDNLMNNICKYGASGTRAYINLEVKDAKVILTFLNTSKDELNISTEELMQRFVRGDSSRNTEGSGLGLSIAQSLTELMGGEMRLSVEGDLFKVELLFPSC